MTTIKLRLNKSKALKDGRYPLVFQLIHARRKRVIYTSHRLFEEEWIEGKERVCYLRNTVRTKVGVQSINTYLKEEKQKIGSIIRQLEKQFEQYTAEDVVVRYTEDYGRRSLFQYIDERIAQKRSSGKEGTASAYNSTRLSLLKYAGRNDVRMEEVNRPFMAGYEQYLSEHVSPNTACFHIRNMKALYNAAARDGYHPECEYPFTQIRTKPCKTVKRALSRDDMQRLVQLLLSEDSSKRLTRDMFLFSFYARGMAFVDVVFLKKENICNDVITYARHKTSQQLRIRLTPQLKTLIETYENASPYIFPILDESNEIHPLYAQYRLALRVANLRLKKIGALLGFEAHLTTYVARHTWATLAKEYGMPTAVISEGLGHTSEQMTQIYLKEFDGSVIDRANEIVSRLG